jgi:hypothetical protein
MNHISRSQSLVWGGLLIVFGLMGLAESYLALSIWTWIGVLAASGVGVFAVFLSDRSERWPLIPAYSLLVVAGLLTTIEFDLLQDPFVATYVLGAIALPFLYVYTQDRTQWWPLIPTYVLLSIALMIPLVELNIMRDAWVGSYVLSTIALPFIVIYLRDRQNWWALIPAYVLVSIGIMIGLIEAGLLNDFLVPAYVMFAVAIPFLFVYFRNPSEWWPLIPGGVMGLMGLGFLLSDRSTRLVAPILVILAGILIIARQLRRPPSGGQERD